jgi:hypothetical protein
MRRKIEEAASGGGLYIRIFLHDFLPEYQGRAPFVPGLSEHGATKPWSTCTGSCRTPAAGALILNEVEESEIEGLMLSYGKMGK